MQDQGALIQVISHFANQLQVVLMYMGRFVHRIHSNKIRITKLSSKLKSCQTINNRNTNHSIINNKVSINQIIKETYSKIQIKWFNLKIVSQFNTKISILNRKLKEHIRWTTWAWTLTITSKGCNWHLHKIQIYAKWTNHWNSTNTCNKWSKSVSKEISQEKMNCFRDSNSTFNPFWSLTNIYRICQSDEVFKIWKWIKIKISCRNHKADSWFSSEEEARKNKFHRPSASLMIAALMIIDDIDC